MLTYGIVTDDVHGTFYSGDLGAAQRALPPKKSAFYPAGHTRESWDEARETVERLGELIGQLPPNRLRSQCIQDLRDGRSYVYFIGGDDTPVKIGFSIAPHERLAALRTAHWADLRILARVEGGTEAESAYHAAFAAHHLHGEWFARVPEIEAEITRLNGVPE